jgi:hypothetical protein
MHQISEPFAERAIAIGFATLCLALLAASIFVLMAGIGQVLNYLL